MIRDPKNHPAAKAVDLERLRELRLAGESNAAIAEALGGSPALVSRLALRMGLPRRGVDPTAPPAIPLATLAELYQVHSLAELGRLLGCSADYVADRLRAYGVKLRRRSEQVSQEWQQHECAALRRCGWSYQKIADALGMTWWKAYRRCQRAGVAGDKQRDLHPRLTPRATALGDPGRSFRPVA